MRWTALLLVAGLAACDGETTIPSAPLGWGPASSTLYTPPEAGGGILGDWFNCQDESCTALGSNGMRFAADGTWTSLYALYYGQGDYPEEQSYCLSEWSSTYTWDGATLTMHDVLERGDLSCRVTFAGDIATFNCLQDYRMYLIRVSAEQVEPCPIYDDLPAGG